MLLRSFLLRRAFLSDFSLPQNMRRPSSSMASRCGRTSANVATVESQVFGNAPNIGAWKEFLFGWSAYTFPGGASGKVTEKSVAEPFIRIQRQLQKDFRNLLQGDCVFVMRTTPEAAADNYANILRRLMSQCSRPGTAVVASPTTTMDYQLGSR